VTWTDPDGITGYHAHVYYSAADAAEKDAAAKLRAAVEDRFDVVMGRWHDKPIGPHPRGSYQIAFAPDQFAALVPWLVLNRGPLTIFLHPETGDAIREHTELAIWLGEREALKLEALN
jgi:DOPA 4,5-dioxygenase